MRPALASGVPYKVALLGEALGAEEAETGAPFVGKAGFKLTRLIEWAGLERGKFDIFNAAWCRPPGNQLEGQPYELPSISHCREAHWGGLLPRSTVIVPMGNVPTHALLSRKGILAMRGYIYPGVGFHILPTVHPSFIQRGQSRYSAAFINDLQKAVTLARDGLPPQVVSYSLDPTPMEAYRWAQEYEEALSRDPSLYLAFDIETPYKEEEEDESETGSDLPDASWNIERIGFAWRPLHALSIPWAPEYRAAISRLLGSIGPKVVWNAGFDVPRIKRGAVPIGGVVHDGMVAWHVLHSDLPKGLGFVATFTCPWQPAWKHLSSSRPAFYNATDADVELRSMLAIEQELRRVDLWGVYTRDVVDLEPLLVHMQTMGMPVDPDIRLDRAITLDRMLQETRTKLEEAIPLSARKVEHVYRNPPADTTGLLVRGGTRLVRRCARCGALKPRKDHFRRLVKKPNPCADAGIREAEEAVEEFYRLASFSPSRHQLVAYHQVLRRPLPSVYDKKTGKRRVSFGEKQLKECILKHPLDPVYPLVLEYRSLDKTAGTYIGRPERS